MTDLSTLSDGEIFARYDANRIERRRLDAELDRRAREWGSVQRLYGVSVEHFRRAVERKSA